VIVFPVNVLTKICMLMHNSAFATSAFSHLEVPALASAQRSANSADYRAAGTAASERMASRHQHTAEGSPSLDTMAAYALLALQGAPAAVPGT
jgi:hypothetical protein